MYYNITNNITQLELTLQTKEKPIVVIGLTYQIDDIKSGINARNHQTLQV